MCEWAELSVSRCILAVACDESCELNCSGAGPSACEECGDGYKMEDSSCEGTVTINNSCSLLQL